MEENKPARWRAAGLPLLNLDGDAGGSSSGDEMVLLTDRRVIHARNGRRRKAVFASVQDIDAIEISQEQQGVGAFLWAGLAFLVAIILYLMIDAVLTRTLAAAVVAVMGVYLLVDQLLLPGKPLVNLPRGRRPTRDHSQVRGSPCRRLRLCEQGLRAQRRRRAERSVRPRTAILAALTAKAPDASPALAEPQAGQHVQIPLLALCSLAPEKGRRPNHCRVVRAQLAARYQDFHRRALSHLLTQEGVGRDSAAQQDAVTLYCSANSTVPRTIVSTMAS